MNKEMLDRFYVELTNPDELGLADPRLREVFDLAAKALAQPPSTERCAHHWVYVANTAGYPFWQCDKCLVSTQNDPSGGRAEVGDKEALREAMKLLEACLSCDLIYNYQETLGLPCDDPNGKDVADVVKEFLAKHEGRISPLLSKEPK